MGTEKQTKMWRAKVFPISLVPANRPRGIGRAARGSTKPWSHIPTSFPISKHSLLHHLDRLAASTQTPSAKTLDSPSRQTTITRRTCSIVPDIPADPLQASRCIGARWLAHLPPNQTSPDLASPSLLPSYPYPQSLVAHLLNPTNLSATPVQLNIPPRIPLLHRSASHRSNGRARMLSDKDSFELRSRNLPAIRRQMGHWTDRIYRLLRLSIKEDCKANCARLWERPKGRMARPMPSRSVIPLRSGKKADRCPAYHVSPEQVCRFDSQEKPY